MELSTCSDSQSVLWGFLDPLIAPPLLFYSYIPIFFITLLFGFLVYKKNQYDWSAKYFLGIALSFASWILLIILQWIAIHVEVVQLSWQLLIIPELLIFLLSAFFCYGYLYKGIIPKYFAWISSITFLLVAVALPTRFNIESFDLSLCEGTVGPLWIYAYVYEIIILVSVAVIAFERLYKAKNASDRKQAIFLPLGIILFLGTFWASNYFGELTQTYEINLVGPVGMALFLAVLSYIIIRFKTFHLKLFSSQVLVFALGALTFSLIFIQNLRYIHAVVIFTFVLVLTLGALLVKSVRKEIEQRERIEILAQDLEHANERLKELDKLKSEFLSFASHQIRSPLTAIKGYSSMLLDGDFGKMPGKVGDSVKIIDESAKGLITIVNEFLDVSRIEQGRMQYNWEDVDVQDLAKAVVDELRPNVEAKGLSFTLEPNENGPFKAVADKGKLKQVIGNLVDNAIKYTPTGGITLGIAKDEKNIVIKISDTGIGIDKSEIPKLFGMFTRATEAHKTNVTGTGLGLYVAKQMIEAHGGNVRVESSGKGKGTTFFISIPSKK